MSAKNENLNNRRIAVNAIYGFSAWIFPLLFSFFSTKILIGQFGASEFGIYTLILSFTGYSFNFNISRALTKYVSEYNGTSDREKIHNIFSATFFVTLVISTVGLAIMLLSSPLIVSDILQINDETYSKTVTGLYFAGAIIFFTLFGQLYGSVLQGLHRFDLVSKISTLSSIILLAGNIVIALLSRNLIWLFLWNLTVIILIFAINFLTTEQLFPLKFGLGYLDRNSLRDVVKFSLSVVGYQVVGNFLLLFERGLLTRNFGTKVLTYYAVPMAVSWQIQYFIASIGQVVFPLVGELKDNPEKLERLYIKATRIIFILVFFIAFSLILHSGKLLTLWLGAEFSERATNLLIIHVISFSIIAATNVMWQLNEAKGFPKYNFFLSFASLLISAPLMIYLGDKYAGEGVALARLAGFIPMVVSLFLLEIKYFGKILTYFWLEFSAKLLTVGILLYIIEAAVNFLFSQSVFAPIISIALGGIVYLSLIWVWKLINEDEKLIVKSFFGIGRYT